MYEQQRSGLGREFRTATERTLSWIAERPLAYPEVLGRWRRALVPKFPYSIIYRPVGDTIYVLACFHTHRNPRHWRKRI